MTKNDFCELLIVRSHKAFMLGTSEDVGSQLIKLLKLGHNRTTKLQRFPTCTYFKIMYVYVVNNFVKKKITIIIKNK